MRSTRIKSFAKALVPPQLVRYRGSANNRKVALTFDDGPLLGHTEAVLRSLRTFKQAATFFVLGQRAEMNPRILESIVAHDCEIGNHSYSHARLSDLSVPGIASEFDHTDQIVERIVGAPPRFVRPPFGELSAKLLRYLWQRRAPAVLWTLELGGDEAIVDCAAESILRDFRASDLQPGEVVLMHDTNEHVVEALPALLSAIQERELECVTLSDLLTQTVTARSFS